MKPKMASLEGSWVYISATSTPKAGSNHLGMFPLLLTVLHRDDKGGVLEPLLRTVSIRGDIPNNHS